MIMAGAWAPGAQVLSVVGQPATIDTDMIGSRTGFVLAFFAASAMLSLAVAYACKVVAIRHALLDLPNDRSAHSVPKPRLGGVGVMTAFLLASIVLVALGVVPAGAAIPVAATCVIALLGLVDDLRPLPARVRFAIQTAAAAAVVATRYGVLPVAAGPLLGWLPSGVLAVVAVLWIVWLTNLYNFMDGIDGLAGGQALIAGLAIAAAAGLHGAPATSALALALAGASLGFLVLNFPPASIFMGDVGSTAIGFFFGCVPLLPEAQPVSFDVVGVALVLFVLDATFTLVRRVAQGQRWYEAHRSHFYQRPLAFGVAHRKITVASYGGFLVVGTLAALMPGAPLALRAALVAAGVALFLTAAQLVRSLERAHARSPEAADRAGTGRRAA